MKIIKSNTGGIILINEDGTIRSIIKSNSVYLHLHPRQDGAILVNDRATCQDDQNSITIIAADVTEIDGTPFSGDRDALLVALDGLFSLGGDSGEGLKAYAQTFKTSKTFSDGNAALLNLFPEVTIQPNKQVRLDIYVPTRHDTNSWGGLYVNVNAKVNGAWYNLGNTGFDGGAMINYANSIHALNHQMILDFIGNLSLDESKSYTLQIELTARTYNGSTYVNGWHDINSTANNLGSRGALQTWASDQNFTHLIITELDR